jgi:diguanylate cyclase (GGDEF)-like protein
MISKWSRQFRPGNYSLLVGTFVLSFAMLAVIWSVYLTRVTNEKNLAFQGAIHENRNIAAMVVANFDEVLGRTKLYATIAATFLDGNRSVASYLNPALNRDGAYLRAAVFDESGRLVYSSAARQEEPEFINLIELARARSAPAASVGMAIGFPPALDSGGWRLPLIVPVSQAAKKNVGFYGAVIDLGFILRLFKDLDLGDGGEIRILRSDGSEAVQLAAATLTAERTRALSPFASLLAGSAMDGTIEVDSIAQLPSSVGVFRKSSQFPLAVIVVRDADVIARSLESQHAKYLARASLSSVVVVLFSIVLFIAWARQQRLYDAVAQSEREKRGLIELLQSEKGHAYQLASQDYLTGLSNRMRFYELAEAELLRAKRSRNLYAFLFIDIDKFKPINDTFGHMVGDLLLKEVAKRLRETVREYDLVARLGGDEFVVLVSAVPSESAVAVIAAKLVAAISAAYRDLNGATIETTPSIGIALYPRDGQAVDTLLSCADSAMYTAKSSGRGQFRFYDASLNASSARKVELAARFKSAIRDGEFFLTYQARVDVDGLRLVGLEALVRWQHPEDGLIFPGDFISLAEEHGFIIPLGDWVVDAACRQLLAWRDQDLPLVPIAVNVSAKQLKDKTFARNFLAAIERHGVNPGMLEIEVTESCFIDEPTIVQCNLDILTANGIKVSLDDYGTGFSGLSSLKSMPIYAIKIDRSFIKELRNDHNDAVIVASTITLAHNLGLIVVAEGVETMAQLVHLKAAGCDQVQGFYLHRPAGAEAIEAILRQPSFALS